MSVLKQTHMPTLFRLIKGELDITHVDSKEKRKITSSNVLHHVSTVHHEDNYIVTIDDDKVNKYIVPFSKLQPLSDQEVEIINKQHGYNAIHQPPTYTHLPPQPIYTHFPGSPVPSAPQLEGGNKNYRSTSKKNKAKKSRSKFKSDNKNKKKQASKTIQRRRRQHSRTQLKSTNWWLNLNSNWWM